MNNLTIVIPAFNEENVIESTLNRVVNYCTQNNINYEILVVDDGSTDKTCEIVNTFEHTNTRLIRNAQNRGKGFSVKTGVLASSMPNILFMDADFSTPIQEIEKLQKHIDAHDIVIGSRKVDDGEVAKSQPKWKQFLGNIGNLLIKKSLNLPYKDTQCGFKLLKENNKKVFEVMSIDRWGFDFELLFLAHMEDLKVKECGVTWMNNEDSKVKFMDYFNTVLDIIRIRSNHRRGKYKL